MVGKQGIVLVFLMLAGIMGVFMMSNKSAVMNASSANSHTPDNLDERFKLFILNNPEVIEESLNNLTEKRKEFANSKREQYLNDNYQDIIENTDFPKFGATSNTKHHIIEFFDYNCGWCKRMMPVKDKTLKENPDVQFIMMELPILGQYSVTATKAALSVYISQPEKYLDFHRELLNTKGSIQSDEIINKALIKVGVDLEKYNTAQKNPKIDSMIAKTRELAINLGIMGTPAYIVNGKLVPGAFSYDELQQMIAN